MKIPLVDLQAQYRMIKEEIDQTIAKTVMQTSFIMGEPVRQFEAEFAAYCGTVHAVGASSGTTALHLALIACQVTAGDEVITVPNTFIATTEAISHCGAFPVFVDVDPDSFNMDPAKLRQFLEQETEVHQQQLVNKRTKRRIKAIVVVHLYGQPADMKVIGTLAQEYKLPIIEDAAQAHGAEYEGKRVGNWGNLACFSFYPGKNLGAYGDGGMVVTNDAQLARQVKLLSDHGRQDKYRHLIIGYNYRLDALQAAILRVKLAHLDHWNEQRRQHAQAYNNFLQPLCDKFDIIIPDERIATRHVYHLYVIRSKQRQQLREYLQQYGISTGIHYPIPLHLQPAYEFLGYKAGAFPVSEQLAEEILSLPIFPELNPAQIEYICIHIRECLENVSR